MELLQLLSTTLHICAIAYTTALLFTFVSGLPKPTPRKAHIALSRPHTQKKPHENALEAPQNHLQVQTHQQGDNQPIQPNYADLSLQQLRNECKKRNITPTGDMRKKSSWIEALS
jgi:hypothetical protein